MPPLNKEQIQQELSALEEKYSEFDKAVKSMMPLNQHSRGRDAEVKNIYDKYGALLSSQLEAFFNGPEGSDDRAVLDWIRKSYIAVRLLTNRRFCDNNSIRLFQEGPVQGGVDAVSTAAMIIMKFAKNPDSLMPDADLLKGEKLKPLSDPEYLEKMKEIAAHFKTLRINGGADKLVSQTKWLIAKLGPQKLEPVKDDFDSDMDILKSHAVKLDEAQTTPKFANSSEYKDIFGLINKITGKQRGDNYSAEDHALNLIGVKMKLDAYIKHKGSDGVKKNVLGKLAEVEALDRFVTSKLKDLRELCGVTLANVNDEKIREYFGRVTEAVPPQRSSRGGLEEKADVMNQSGFGADAEKTAKALDCMDKIIQKAPEAKRTALARMRGEFLEVPVPYTAAELESLAADAKKAVDKADNVFRLNKDTRDKISAVLGVNGDALSTADQMYFHYALEFKTETEEHSSSKHKVVPLSASTAMSRLKKVADSYDAMIDPWDTDREGAISRSDSANSLRVDLISMANQHMKDHAQENLALAQKKMSDKELIERWPELDLKLGLYCECTDGRYFYPENEPYKTIIEKHREMDERVRKLSEFKAKDLEAPSTGKQNSPNAEINLY